MYFYKMYMKGRNVFGLENITLKLRMYFEYSQTDVCTVNIRDE